MASKKSLIITLIIVAILAAVTVGVFIIYNQKTGALDSKKESKSNSKEITIDGIALEKAIKKAIMEEIASEEVLSNSSTVYAEGHKTIKSEVKDGKIYAYLKNKIAAYMLNEKGKYFEVAKFTEPLVIIFDKEYKFDSYEYPKDKEGETYEQALIRLFPENILDKVKSEENYANDEYEKQIQNYLSMTDNGENKDQEVDGVELENVIKQVLTSSVVNDIMGNAFDQYNNKVNVEGHRTLKVTLKNNKVCAYVKAFIGSYVKENEYKEKNVNSAETITSKSGQKYTLLIGKSSPIALIFEKDENGKYKYSNYQMPEDGKNFEESVKKIFPEYLVDEAMDKDDYTVTFYQDQIKNYLN